MEILNGYFLKYGMELVCTNCQSIPGKSNLVANRHPASPLPTRTPESKSKKIRKQSFIDHHPMTPVKESVNSKTKRAAKTAKKDHADTFERGPQTQTNRKFPISLFLTDHKTLPPNQDLNSKYDQSVPPQKHSIHQIFDAFLNTPQKIEDVELNTNPFNSNVLDRKFRPMIFSPINVGAISNDDISLQNLSVEMSDRHNNYENQIALRPPSYYQSPITPIRSRGNVNSASKRLLDFGNDPKSLDFLGNRFRSPF